jgi:hypothetical protein
MPVRMSLLVGEGATDFRQAPLDPFVDDEATADHGADARRNLAV